VLFSTCVFTMLFLAKYLKPLDKFISREPKGG
jgi:hypothetical protein